MNFVVFLAGIWVAILPYMKWNNCERLFSIVHIFVGINISISSILSFYFDTAFGLIFIVVAYILLCFLEIAEIIRVFINRHSMLDKLSIITGFV
ncbi:MAG: hypothetical protein ACI4E1_00685 [Lachnospira sp.]